VIGRRILAVTLVTLTGLALETALFGSATLAGTKPQLLLLVTVALGIVDGPALGAVAGFSMGFATDLLLGLPKGVTALVYTIIGYAAGSIRAQLQAPASLGPIIAIEAAAAFVSVFLYAGVSAMLGRLAVGGGEVATHAGLAAVYNALLTPFVFPVIRAIAGRIAPMKAYR
jgi:rod shape-determining protein MreD